MSIVGVLWGSCGGKIPPQTQFCRGIVAPHKTPIVKKTYKNRTFGSLVGFGGSWGTWGASAEASPPRKVVRSVSDLGTQVGTWILGPP